MPVLLLVPCLLVLAPPPARGGPPPGGVLLTVHDSAPGTRFGAALDGVGDVDLDGVPDLVVGAYRTGGGAGAVRLVSGAGGAVLWSLDGAGGDWLGHAVAAAGDLDGDGTQDVLAGAPLAAGGLGRLLALSGRDGAQLWSHTGPAPGGRFGHALARLGDVDGDGVEDLAVSAPLDSGAGTYAGRVEVRSGVDGALLWALAGAPFDQLGHDLAGVGDVDGDGLGDLLVGAPFDDRGGFNAGAVVLASGASGTRVYELFGRAAGDWMGQRVAAAGDVDRDGIGDLLVGVPGADAAGIDSGAAQARSGLHGGLLFEVAGEAPGEYLMSVAGPGDVDGDGAADVLVGAASGGSAEAGRARLVSGRTQAELCRFDGLGPKDWFAAALAPVGDVDGDGAPDLAVGAPGHDDEPGATGYVQLLRCPTEGAPGLGSLPSAPRSPLSESP